MLSSSEDDSEASTIRQAGHEASQHSMASSYRRPSFVAFGGTRPAVASAHAPATEASCLTKKEKKQSRDEERSLLRDNHLGEW